MDKKILITGTGIISAMGRNTREVAMNLYKGKCGLYHDKIREHYLSELCGRVTGWNGDYSKKLTRTQLNSMPLHGFYALDSVFEALRKAKISDDFLQNHNVSVIVSNDSECYETKEVVHHVDYDLNNRYLEAGTLFKTLNSAISMNLATILGIHGLSLTVSAACAGGGHAIGLAKMLLDSKQTEMVIVIGAQECTSRYCMEAFDAFRNLPPQWAGGSSSTARPNGPRRHRRQSSIPRQRRSPGLPGETGCNLPAPPPEKTGPLPPAAANPGQSRPSPPAGSYPTDITGSQRRTADTHCNRYLSQPAGIKPSAK